MRIISDITNKDYPTVEECLAAEAAFIAEQQKEKLAAAQREEERKQLEEQIEAARAHYHTLINQYNETYGTYKRVYTVNTHKDLDRILSDLFK